MEVFFLCKVIKIFFPNKMLEGSFVGGPQSPELGRDCMHAHAHLGPPEFQMRHYQKWPGSFRSLKSSRNHAQFAVSGVFVVSAALLLSQKVSAVSAPHSECRCCASPDFKFSSKTGPLIWKSTVEFPNIQRGFLLPGRLGLRHLCGVTDGSLTSQPRSRGPCGDHQGMA